ncbi:HEPN domain-containing protein [Pseudoxanthomonas sangjuensis]|uniref:HEPN domain-containing protein n=1 Tax=Pseudoxanthomonas sangjuensis TaxID=1503750 RepID=UPI001390C552|nr:HEPN domain-containing protein [Pseudoxanthomonas sangjuensis]
MERSPSLKFKDNLGEVFQLISIHSKLTGDGPGRRNQVDALNKSAVVFACASFEAFVEDLASSAFDHIADKSPSISAIPIAIRRAIAKRLKEDPHELRIWDMADTGWRTVAASYKEQIIQKHIGPFNTPKHGNVASLLKELLGFDAMDSCFRWKGMPQQKAKENLNKFVQLRGELAHGKRPAPRVTKAAAIRDVRFLALLSVRMSNVMRVYCHSITGHYPWPAVHIGSVE